MHEVMSDTSYDDAPAHSPTSIGRLRTAAHDAGFTMSSEDRTGSLLAALAANRPGGRILELGTGVGEGTAWPLAGMDATARLTTVELDGSVQGIAAGELAGDPRVEFVAADGGAWLETYTGPRFDLIFADTWPGKFTHLDEALSLVAPGGFYVVDDLARQPERMVPEGHQLAVEALIGDLESRSGWERLPLLGWSCGVLVMVRR